MARARSGHQTGKTTPPPLPEWVAAFVSPQLEEENKHSIEHSHPHRQKKKANFIDLYKIFVRDTPLGSVPVFDDSIQHFLYPIPYTILDFQEKAEIERKLHENMNEANTSDKIVESLEALKTFYDSIFTKIEEPLIPKLTCKEKSLTEPERIEKIQGALHRNIYDNIYINVCNIRTTLQEKLVQLKGPKHNLVLQALGTSNSDALKSLVSILISIIKRDDSEDTQAPSSIPMFTFSELKQYMGKDSNVYKNFNFIIRATLQKKTTSPDNYLKLIILGCLLGTTKLDEERDDLPSAIQLLKNHLRPTGFIKQEEKYEELSSKLKCIDRLAKEMGIDNVFTETILQPPTSAQHHTRTATDAICLQGILGSDTPGAFSIIKNLVNKPSTLEVKEEKEEATAEPPKYGLVPPPTRTNPLESLLRKRAAAAAALKQGEQQASQKR